MKYFVPLIIIGILIGLAAGAIKIFPDEVTKEEIKKDNSQINQKRNIEKTFNPKNIDASSIYTETAVIDSFKSNNEVSPKVSDTLPRESVENRPLSSLKYGEKIRVLSPEKSFINAPPRVPKLNTENFKYSQDNIPPLPREKVEHVGLSSQKFIAPKSRGGHNNFEKPLLTAKPQFKLTNSNSDSVLPVKTIAPKNLIAENVEVVPSHIKSITKTYTQNPGRPFYNPVQQNIKNFLSKKLPPYLHMSRFKFQGTSSGAPPPLVTPFNPYTTLYLPHNGFGGVGQFSHLPLQVPLLNIPFAGIL